MCGIVGYTGKNEALPVLLDGLRRLEYRGYDSSGLAVAGNGSLDLRKCAGRIRNLAELTASSPLEGHSGISHTRWATHGEPTDENAHPHFDQSGRLALVHNGVIENYRTLRRKLEAEDHTFSSETDSEVLAHLIGKHYDASKLAHSPRRMMEAIRAALRQVSGTYGIAVIHQDIPDSIFGARLGSPLVLGIGKEENFLAADVSAIVAYTREAVYLNDYDIVSVTGKEFAIENLTGGKSSFSVSEVDYSAEDAELGDFPHFMLKEIFEQPESVRNAFRGRLSKEEATAKLGGLHMTPMELRDIERIVIAGCGTACHAAMVGEYLIEHLARIPTEVEFASELRYRNMPTDKNTLLFVVSQSGETIDTLEALREGKRKGHRVLGVCNNVASTIARESDGGVYMHAGPEIGVAATKSFTSQLTVFTLLALLLGRMSHLQVKDGLDIISELRALPGKIGTILKQSEHIKEIAQKYVDAEGMLFFGRQFNYPTALEGALKMKEISYIYASGHPSAELKHGIIALVKESLPSVVIAPHDTIFDKNVNNIEEIRARKGPVIAVTTTSGEEHLAHLSNDVIVVPDSAEYLSPILCSIPLQLLAYHLAVLRGCDVDKPRNLAKSVTVE
ncbi:glutamine--fructose-6-phosphate transaminase (isomerizing) [soil metagenome]